METISLSRTISEILAVIYKLPAKGRQTTAHLSNHKATTEWLE